MLSYKEFKVASVSDNRNSFGLKGMILIAKDGDAWQAAANDINVKKKGEVLNVVLSPRGEPDWWSFGFEIPERLPQRASEAVVKEVWG